MLLGGQDFFPPPDWHHIQPNPPPLTIGAAGRCHSSTGSGRSWGSSARASRRASRPRLHRPCGTHPSSNAPPPLSRAAISPVASIPTVKHELSTSRGWCSPRYSLRAPGSSPQRMCPRSAPNNRPSKTIEVTPMIASLPLPKQTQ